MSKTDRQTVGAAVQHRELSFVLRADQEAWDGEEGAATGEGGILQFGAVTQSCPTL